VIGVDQDFEVVVEVLADDNELRLSANYRANKKFSISSRRSSLAMIFEAMDSEIDSAMGVKDADVGPLASRFALVGLLLPKVRGNFGLLPEGIV